jgi:large subunit ribosomal protein L4
MKVQVFTAKGVRKEDKALPKEFGQKVGLPLLAQALYVYEERSHIGLRKTKTRAEVERTTKKLYKQKGTGGARHGSRRAPIFVGGGVALGPRPVKRILRLPSSVKNKARIFAFALKAEEKQLIFVSGLQRLGKTKEAAELLNVLQKKTEAKRFTFVLSEKSRGMARILRNLPNANHLFYKDANALDIYRGGMILLDDEIFKKEVKTKSK